MDDILESGRTLAFARERLLNRGAHSVKIAALLDKPERRKLPYLPIMSVLPVLISLSSDMVWIWATLGGSCPILDTLSPRTTERLTATQESEHGSHSSY